jgi:hypothetical protein
MPFGFSCYQRRLHGLKNWTVFFAVFLLLVIILSRAAAAAQPIPLDGFWDQVQKTLAWLDSPHTPSEWADQASTWSAIKQVSLPGGQTVAIDPSEIVRRLSSSPPDVKGLQSYLSALQSARQQWPQANCGDCKASLLSEILARPEFAQPDNAGNPVQQFFQQLAQAVLRWLNSLFGGSTSAPGLPSEIFTVIISALLIVILYFVFKDVFGSLASEAELAGTAPGEGQPLTASLASQKAVDLAGGGDYRAAVRYLYLSALLLLDERGLLRYNRTLTNREYLQQVRGQPDLEDNLRWIVDEFDRVWYGFQPIDREEYAAYLGHVSAIEAIKI